MTRTRGAIFCQVIKIIEFVHLNPSMTDGNQKWNGAVPLLINRAVVMRLL